MFEKLREKIERFHWEDAAELSWWLRLAHRQVKLYFYITRELVRDRCLQQAAALTFTTLLSLVPLFAVAFSLYRSFAGIEGLGDRAQDVVLDFLLAGPLVEGTRSAEETEALDPQALKSASPDELMDRARSSAVEGEEVAALQLCLAALRSGADPGQVRQQMSFLALPSAAKLQQYVAEPGGEALEAYMAGAGLPGQSAAPSNQSMRAAHRAYGEAMRLYARGEFEEALRALREAEEEGYPPAAARQFIARVHKEAAQRAERGQELREATDHYEKALVHYLDALMLAATGRGRERLTALLQEHRETRRALGELLLKRGRREANLYASLRERTDAEARNAAQAAVQDLERAAMLLEHSGEADEELADLLWEEVRNRERARRHYKAALRKQAGEAAEGISLAVGDYLRSFIEKVGRARIGILATVFLLVTATSVLSTIEKTLNNVWKVTEKRSFWIKFTSFWTLICLGPVMIGATVWARERLGQYVTMTLTDMPLLGGVLTWLMAAGQYLLPFITTWLLLVALYKFLPHTRVKFTSAAWGAFVGALLIQLARPLFGLYVQNALKYQRIYGSLGAIPIFLLWMWLLWVIVLFGAEISFTIQNVSLLHYHDKLRRLSDVFIDRYLAARIMMYVAREFWETGQPLSVDRLAEILQITPEEAGDAARRLVNLGLLTPVGDQRDEFHPARDLSKLKLSEVLSVTDRFRDESRSRQPENRPYEQKLEAAFRCAIRAQQEALEGLSLRKLLEKCEKDRDKWPRRAEEGGQ